MSGSTEQLDRSAWTDATRAPEQRVAALLQSMTLREKLAQLYGLWLGADPQGADVAPNQTELTDPIDLDALLPHGLGQITRAFGTGPVDAAEGAAALARIQRRIADANRHGIPALAHEECLAGFTTYGATCYPVPLAWGATWHPELIGEMATRIGTSMHALGVHQGLAPVLDVTRDPRWGRTEETIGEDPYLVGTIATAYIRGLESTGIVATLKHFAGYSASRGGRNLGPVPMGPREFGDVVLPPFEMAVRESGVRSVMHSYTEIDGMPSAADESLLTGLLRDTWGFTGTVVADYFGITFLKLHHGIAGDWGEAGALALRAGVDVELPSVKAYADALLGEIDAGRVPESLVDRALERVLRQKLELGMLDADWSPLPAGWSEGDAQVGAGVQGRVDLDSPADRELARRIAEESVVLLRNDGTLPLAAPRRIAVIGPTADAGTLLLGCYHFPNHVGVHHPELPLGVDIPSVVDGIRAEFPAAEVVLASGCAVDTDDRSGFDAALAAAASADLVVLALGDRAALFGGGTSGEGCDAATLDLPGVQAQLLETVLDAGTPTIVALVSGRPYLLGTAPERAAGIVQAFFPGEEGASAIAGVISGRVSPSGRLPVSVPAQPGGQPWTYLTPKLAGPTRTGNIDTTPRYPFGYGLSFTTFEWSDGAVSASTLPVDGETEIAITVHNAGDRAGVEVVQLYVHDPVAQVTRPVTRLLGYARVELAAGAASRVSFTVPADVTSFHGRAGHRIVEPGDLELRLGASSTDTRFAATVHVTGAERPVDHTRRLHCPVTVTPVPAGGKRRASVSL